MKLSKGHFEQTYIDSIGVDGVNRLIEIYRNTVKHYDELADSSPDTFWREVFKAKSITLTNVIADFRLIITPHIHTQNEDDDNA